MPRSVSEAAAATDVSEHQTQRGRAASGHSAHQLSCSPSQSRDSHELWDCSVALCHCSGTFCPACTDHFLFLSTGLWDGSTVLEPRAGSSVVPSVSWGLQGCGLICRACDGKKSSASSCPLCCPAFHISGCSVFGHSVAEKSGGGWSFCVP